MKPVTRTLKSGLHLFRENDRSRELYIIQSGKVKVYKTVGSKEIELAVMGKGAVLGEMALIDGKPRSASAVVMEECTIMQIDFEAVQKKIQGVPSWYLHLIKLCSQKIRNTNIRLHAVSPQRQGAALIVTLGYLFEKNDYDPLKTASTKLKLIQLLGSNFLKTTKVLELLCEMEFIRQSGEELELVMPDELKKYCRYLRFLLRGNYRDFDKLHPGILNLAFLIAEQFPPLLEESSASFRLKGDLLWSFYLQCDLRDFHEIVTDKLMKDGLLTVEKKLSSCQIEHPFSRSELRLKNPGWMKLSLYEKFKDMDPSI